MVTRTTKRSTSSVEVKQAEPPIPTEILAEAIVKVSVGFEAAMKAGLTKRAICILVKAHTGVGVETVATVLDCLPQLGKLYTTR